MFPRTHKPFIRKIISVAEKRNGYRQQTVFKTEKQLERQEAFE